VHQYRVPNAEALVGTPEQVLEKLAQYEGLGYVINNFPESAYDRSGVELYEREVLAKLS
jgi:hypothetical protein